MGTRTAKPKEQTSFLHCGCNIPRSSFPVPRSPFSLFITLLTLTLPRPKSAKAKMSRSKDQTFNTLKTNYTGESWDQGSAQWSVPSMPSMVIKILPEATMMLHKSGRRKASPETPLSAPTQSENFKVKNTMRVMDDFEKRRERFDSSQGEIFFGSIFSNITLSNDTPRLQPCLPFR